jgi:hypothetical protein
MRCDEVVRELACPTDDRDRAALADHLAACPACAEWVRRAHWLDRLWDATRPAEPSPEAWGSVWANIAQSLDASAPARREEQPAPGPRPSRNGTGPKIHAHSMPMPARPRSRSWRLAAIGLVGLAQAAAILVAIGLVWRGQPTRVNHNIPFAQNDKPPAPTAVRTQALVKFEAEIDVGCLAVIREDGPSVQLVDKTPPEMAYSADGGLPMLNAMESIAVTRVAAQ